MNAFFRGAIPLCLLLLWPAPAPAAEQHYRAHPDYMARMRAVKTIGLVRPAMRLFELTSGGGRTFKPDWSESSAKLVADALAAALAERGFSVTRVDPMPQDEQELRDVALLYESVGNAILQATYINQFPRKVARFEYSLGDLDPLLAPRGVDAVVFAYGTANISSAGRSALQVLGAIAGTGYSVGIDRIYLALVDRSGAVLWFDSFASTGHDLRDPASTSSFVRNITDHLPEVKR